MKDKSNHRIIGVEPVTFLSMIYLSIEMTAYQDLVSTKCCLQLLNTTDLNMCKNMTPEIRERVKSETSQWLMYYNMLRNLLPVLLSFYIGPWNEMLGWKRPMMVPPAFAVFSCLNLLLNSVYLDLHIGYILISPFLCGISTDVLGWYASIFGYVADTTDLDSRSKRMTIVQAFVMVGRAIGGYAASAMMAYTTYNVIFLFLMFVNMANVMYICFALKDVRSENARTSIGCGDLFSLRNLKDSISSLVKKRDDNVRMIILLLFIANFVQYLGYQCELSLFYVLVTDEPLAWSASQYSAAGAFKTVLQGVNLLVLLPLGYHFFALRDCPVSIASSFSRLASLVFMSVSQSTAMIYSAIGLHFFSDADMVTVRSMLTKLVDFDEKGRIMALLGTMQTFAKLFGSFIFNGLYPVTSPFFKGFSFALAGAIQLVSIVIFMYVHKSYERRTTGYEGISGSEKDEKVEKKN